MTTTLTARQADGQACVWCGLDYGQPAGFDVAHVPVGHSETGSQIFACRVRCAEKYESFQARRDAFPGARLLRDLYPDDTDLLATGTITGLTKTFTATFTPAHRAGNDTPAVLACTVTMPLSFEDAVAALWVAARNGTLREDMTGPDDLHAVVVYTLVNHNTDVAAARREIDNLSDDAVELEHAAIQLTMAVVRAYGNGTAPPAAPGSTFSLLGPVMTPASNPHRVGAPNHHTGREGRAGLRVVTD